MSYICIGERFLLALKYELLTEGMKCWWFGKADARHLKLRVLDTALSAMNDDAGEQDDRQASRRESTAGLDIPAELAHLVASAATARISLRNRACPALGVLSRSGS
jgi:hypothetical protein